MDDKLIFERSFEGRRAVFIPETSVAKYSFPDKLSRKSEPKLPEVAKIDVVRHYTNLSKKAFGVDNGFYPLGSCTMKYNPKVNETVAAMPGFTSIHPLQSDETSQGCMEVIYRTAKYLSELNGMDEFTLQPSAGAHGELTGLLMIKAYHTHHGNSQKTKVIVPDTAHGTNPATASMCGFDVITIPSKSDGNVDVDALKAAVGDDTAALMLTNPNTVGMFEKDVKEMADIVHDAGGLLYYDGANLNAIMGVVRPGDMGFDVVHLNLHKTLSTPHGGGGPGSGAVGCKNILKPFIPGRTVIEENGKFVYQTQENTIGSVSSFQGNFLVYIKALTYMLTLGGEGLLEASQNAVLNANYMLERLDKKYTHNFSKPCMHEFVLSVADLKKKTGISAMDIAKGLIDNDIHPPTVYFPLNVEEALMIEPTETETVETLDRACDVFLELYDQAFEDPDKLHEAPIKAFVRRVNDVHAARHLVLKYEED